MLQKRTNECFTRDVRNALKLISLTGDVQIQGSYSYVVHPYPGDIDCMERITLHGTPIEVSQKVAKKIQDMVTRVLKRKNTYISDFKAGEDIRYAFDWLAPFGTVFQQLQVLHHDQLLSKKELQTWIDTLSNEPRETFLELVRTKLVIRWTRDDLLRGSKKLPGNIDYSLAEALRSNTRVKIDIITTINGFYTEVTNIYMITAIQPSSKEALVLTELSTKDYYSALREELIKYSDPKLKKHLKLAKRFWSYTYAKNPHSKDLFRLNELLRSDIAKLGQVYAILETVLVLYEKFGIFTSASFVQVDRLNFIFGSISQKILSSARASEICGIVNSLDRNQSKNVVVEKIQKLSHILHDIIDDQTKKYLRRTGLLKKIQAVIQKPM